MLLGLFVVILITVAGSAININTFSLNGLYRNRLMRAYLAASNPCAAPDTFTGFDARDNLKLIDLWNSSAVGGASAGRMQPRLNKVVSLVRGWLPLRVQEPARAQEPDQKQTVCPDNAKCMLFHVINATVNLASEARNRQDDSYATPRARRHERPAASFTFTPLHVGSPVLGYRPTRAYDAQDWNGVRLAAAMAISGAAVSPNMGYHTSGTVRLLLTLFNVRLGGWLGNPARENHRLRYHPRFALGPILAEAFGRLTRRNRYVYLSDGGHFDNLGLYEMVRRRCQLIVVSDASADPMFAYDALADAIRRIRLDEGVEITLYDLLEQIGRAHV